MGKGTEYMGSGVRKSSYALWLIPAHHTSSGSRACWLTQNPNTQVTSHHWTNREVSGNSTHSAVATPETSPTTVPASKSWSPSRSFSLPLGWSEERTSQAHSTEWNLACCKKLGKGPRPWKVTSHYLRPVSASVQVSLFKTKEVPWPRPWRKGEERENGLPKYKEFNGTYKGSSYPFLQWTLIMQVKLSCFLLLQKKELRPRCSEILPR